MVNGGQESTCPTLVACCTCPPLELLTSPPHALVPCRPCLYTLVARQHHHSTALVSLHHCLTALVGCRCRPPPPILAASRGSCCWQSVVLTAGTLMSPLPGPPIIVRMPPVVLPLCGVVCTLETHLEARPAILRLLGEGRRAIAAVEADADANAHVCSCIIVIIVTPVIPLLLPQSRAMTTTQSPPR